MRQALLKNSQVFYKTFKAYVAICKFKLVALLFFTGFVSALIASSIYGFNWKTIGILSVAIILSVMGSNASTAYIDRDMDKLMSRTQKRPVPSGSIFPPKNALIYGITLVAAGIFLGAYISWLAAIFIFLGFLDSSIIYNLILKKRSPLNIIFAAPAGGMPVLAGWAAVAQNRINIIAIFMFILVIIWTPAHIWTLAYFYREDYRKAGVPMLSSIWSRKKVFILLSVLNSIMVLFSVYVGYYFKLSFVFMTLASLLGLAIIILSIMLLVKNKKETVWILFKFSSPYLAIIFVLLVVEYLWIK